MSDMNRDLDSSAMKPTEPQASGLGAVGDPGAREALAFVRAQPAAASADDVAAALGVHRNVARGRLERLVGAGLLEVAYERRTGRAGPGAGRPAKVYRATPDVAAIEFPQRNYAALLGLVADEVPDDEGLQRSGARFASLLAADSPPSAPGSFADAVAALRATLTGLGYGTTLESIDDDEAVLSTPVCPLRPLVVEAPAAVAIDCGMWAELLMRSLPPQLRARVSCETSDCLEPGASCRIRLRIAPDSG
jgi:predicted ArsR family transcriptional regulator